MNSATKAAAKAAAAANTKITLASQNLRKLWKSVPLPRLKQGSTLSIQSSVPLTKVVFRSAWRDDGHAELQQVLRRKHETNDPSVVLAASPPPVPLVQMAVTEHASQETSLGRLEPHISIHLDYQNESADLLSSQVEGNSASPTRHGDEPPQSQFPPPYIHTVTTVKKEMDRVILDDGTIHPITDPEIASQMEQQEQEGNQNTDKLDHKHKQSDHFRRTDYNDGIAHLESLSSSTSNKTVAPSDETSTSSSFDGMNEQEGNDGTGTFLSLEVPEKLNVVCRLHQGGSIHFQNKQEGDAKLFTQDGNILVKKIRGHDVQLETKNGVVYVSELVEAQNVSVRAETSALSSRKAPGRIRAKQIHGTFVNLGVRDEQTTQDVIGDSKASLSHHEENTYNHPEPLHNHDVSPTNNAALSLMDMDDEGSRVDVSALYVSGNGGAKIKVNQIRKLERRAVRVKSIHGPLRVELNQVPEPKQYNQLLIPPERYPLVELGGVNGNCEVDIAHVLPSGDGKETSSSRNNSDPEDAWNSCIVHVDSLAPESVSLISAQKGDIRITIDRKVESDLRLLSLSNDILPNPQVVTQSSTLLAEEEDSRTIVRNLFDEFNLPPPSNISQDRNNIDQPKRILIDTKAFTPRPATPGSSNDEYLSKHYQYIEGWVENKSAEPDSRFERRTKGDRAGGKIRIEQAASLALDGFQQKKTNTTELPKVKIEQEQPAEEGLRPLFVATAAGSIKLETLSWVGAIARRYGLDDGNRGLGRTATRRGRGLTSTTENDVAK